MLGVLLVVGLVIVALVVTVGIPAISQVAPQRAAERAVVTRVIDGDTIVVRVDGREERVRYIGVDAPELAGDRSGERAECGGEQARAANEDLVAGATVELERDVSDRDRFGRLLRHVWVNGGLVSEELAREGFVEARSYPPDTGRDGQLDAAERAARADGAGLWGAC